MKRLRRLQLVLSLAPLLALSNACHDAAASGEEASAAAGVREAVAVLVPVGESGVSGEVRFESGADSVRVHGTLEGLEPGRHGFHVHAYGDLSDRTDAASAGGHFAPAGRPHGRPSGEERHVGDLGNVVANEDGVAEIELEDRMLRLEGGDSIVGRAVVVHAEADEFTQPSGNAGGRVAFGVIGIANPEL